MRTVASPSRFATGAISRSKTSPSASSATAGGTASGRPAASVGKTSVVRVLGVCSFMSGSFDDRLRTKLFDRRGRCGSRSLRARGDSAGEELGVILDPADESRPARVLPGEAEEVEAGNVGHASAVTNAPVLIAHRRLDPRVVGAVARRPDHGVDVEVAAVGEADRASARGDDARLQVDAVAPPELARARADQRVAILEPASDPGVDRFLDQARLRQPPEEVASEEPLRQRLLPRADGEVNLVGRGELLRDLVAGVTSADDDNPALRHV